MEMGMGMEMEMEMKTKMTGMRPLNSCVSSFGEAVISRMSHIV